MINGEENVKQALREIPQVEALLKRLEQVEGIGDKPREVQKSELKRLLESIRRKIMDGAMNIDDVRNFFGGEDLIREMKERLSFPPYHVGVINATGVVMHTGLGRAPLAREAVEAIASCSRYCRLEVDPLTGERSRREEAVKELLIGLTGAESGLVVNNNAGATLLALNTLASGKEVAVSRAEMVEIGGSYRMPEVMRYAGCRLVDVGCTNRTYVSDFRAAVTEETALFLKVHTSNYRISGFVERPSLEDLVNLGKEMDIPVMEDLGSGFLWEEPVPGLEEEPRVKDSVAAGADIICFSGDKLLGACQAGIIIGRRELVERCRRNPLYRALRCDKLCLSALEATLRIYSSKELVEERIPALRYLLRDYEELKKKARRLKAAIDRKGIDGLGTFLIDGTSRAGSGSAPDQDLPTRLVALKPPCDVEVLVKRMRMGSIPVFARVSGDTVLLDPRTLEDEEISLVADAVEWALKGNKESPGTGNRDF